MRVRSALATVLPNATRFRRVGLITYGPGPYNQCNVQLNFEPIPNAADLIMGVVDALTPAGKTPRLPPWNRRPTCSTTAISRVLSWS